MEPASNNIPIRIDLAKHGVAPRLRSTEIGQGISISGVELEGLGVPVAFEVRRVQVFTEDAQIVVHSNQGDRVIGAPDNVYLKGSVSGTPRSRVFLTLRENGAIRGLVTSEGRGWIVSANSPGENWTNRKISEDGAKSTGSSFSCGADSLTMESDILDQFLGAENEVSANHLRDTKAAASYTARVAVETDWEFYQIFGDVDDATDYVADIVGYASGIYADEVDTTLLLSYVSLWTTSADPWNQNSTICGLFQFGQFWHYNRGSVSRTVAHFMSGKALYGGIAWTGVLCSGAFNPSAWGYTPSNFGCTGLTPDSDYYGGAYGFTASISGSFNAASPSPVWDIISVSHEIGHNFSSPHTHCYKNIGGNSNPVDECYANECSSSCNCNSPSLPCAQAGAGCGTIMSYCHLLGGSYSNISLTFGEDHPYGIAPERVPARMYSHVLSAAAASPSCLAYVSEDDVFEDGFETNDTALWSQTVP